VELVATPAPAPAATPEPAPAATAEPAPASVVRRSARDPATIAAALQVAPGLPPADSAEMLRLTELLTDGACPTDALRDAFGTINRQTLVALVRALGTC
jgi:hypothetical protein